MPGAIDYSKWDRVGDDGDETSSTSSTAGGGGDDEHDEGVVVAGAAGGRLVAPPSSSASHYQQQRVSVERVPAGTAVTVGAGGVQIQRAGGGAAAVSESMESAAPERPVEAAPMRNDTGTSSNEGGSNVRVVYPTDPEHPSYGRKLPEEADRNRTNEPAQSRWTRNGAWAELRWARTGEATGGEAEAATRRRSTFGLPLAWSQSAETVTVRAILGFEEQDGSRARSHKVLGVRVVEHHSMGSTGDDRPQSLLHFTVERVAPARHARGLSLLRRGDTRAAGKPMEEQVPAVVPAACDMRIPLRHLVKDDEESLCGAWSVEDVDAADLAVRHGCPLVPMVDDELDDDDGGDNDTQPSLGPLTARVLVVELKKVISAPLADVNDDAGALAAALAAAGGPARLWWLSLARRGDENHVSPVLEEKGDLDPSRDLPDRAGKSAGAASRFAESWEDAHRMFRERQQQRHEASPPQ